jgi:hypothetical protein
MNKIQTVLGFCILHLLSFSEGGLYILPIDFKGLVM